MAEPAYANRPARQAATRHGLAEQRRARLRVLAEEQPSRRVRPIQLATPTLVSLALSLALAIMAPFASIWLVNDTLRVMIINDSLAADIAQGQADGHRLESEYTSLTNPQGIQRQAMDMGMAPDPGLEYLHIDPDLMPDGSQATGGLEPVPDGGAQSDGQDTLPPDAKQGQSPADHKLG
jgi:hypothetical protein